MKREYLAIAVVSLLVLAPSALALETHAALDAGINDPAPAAATFSDSTISQYRPQTVVNTDIFSDMGNARYQPTSKVIYQAEQPVPDVAPVVQSEDPQPDAPSAPSERSVSLDDVNQEAVQRVSAPIPNLGESEGQVCRDSEIDESGSDKLAEKGRRRTDAMNRILNEMQGRSKQAQNTLAARGPDVDPTRREKDAMIPTELEGNAQCMMIIPGEKSIGYTFGAEYGAGAYKCKDQSGNFEPQYHYVQLEGGSWGLQIGVKSTDRVLFFMNHDAVSKLRKLEVMGGARVAATAGPIGRDASLSTDYLAKEGIVSYSRSKGLYAGITLEGATIRPDRNMNAIMNGDSVTKKKHKFLFFRFGHRDICQVASDQQRLKPAFAPAARTEEQPVVAAAAK